MDTVNRETKHFHNIQGGQFGVLKHTEKENMEIKQERCNV